MHPDKKTVVVYLLLLAAMLVWGLSFLAIQSVVGTVPVFTLLFLRFGIATIILGLFVGVKRELFLPRRDLLILAGLTLLSPIGYFLFETFGVIHTQPGRVATIIATIPTVVYLIALFFRREKAAWQKGVGIAVAYLGIFIIIGAGRDEVGASLLGDLLVIGAVLCAAVRTVLVKDVLKRVTPLQLTFYQFFFSLFLFGPLAATDGLCWTLQITPMVVAEVLFLGILCSAGAFLALHYALAHLSVTQVAVSANFIPIITLFAEILLLGTILTPARGIGTAAVVIGVMLAQLSGRPTRAAVIGIEEG